MVVPRLFRANHFKLTIYLVNARAGGKATNKCSHNLGPRDILDSIQLFHQ